MNNSQMNKVILSDSLSFLKNEPQDSYDTIYIDPPFNTGLERVSSAGRQRGFYNDRYSNYCQWFAPFIEESHRLLKETGSIFVHLDSREVFDVKVNIMDKVFGKENFVNDIIWSYDYGGRGKDRWPKKHDTILFYCKDNKKRYFDWEACDRIPYLAPGLQKDPARVEKGKVTTDVWWMSIVGTQSKERTRYPTQKPVNLIKRALRATTPKNGKVLDFFAGSGTTGIAAHQLGLEFVVVDSSSLSIDVIKERLEKQNVVNVSYIV